MASPKEPKNAEEQTVFEIPLAWVGLHDAPVEAVSHFICQFESGAHILTVGMASPPILIGTKEERRRQIKDVTHVPVNVVAKLSLTPEVLERLILIVKENQANLRKAQAAAAGGKK